MTASINASTSSGVVVTSDTSGALALQTASTTAMTIDTSQNVGIGVTPSAWNSVYKGFQIGLGASVFGRTANSNAAISANAFVNSAGNFQYINTEAASNYLQGGGVHYWSTAPSGTAGNAITFTQAMTLDASGQLLIGATSGSYPLVVKKAASSSDTSSIQIMSGTAGYSQLLFGNTGSDSPGYLAYNNSSNFLAIATNGSERARIDSSGNLMVGTTSASSSITNGFTVTGPAAVTALGIGHVAGSGSGTNFVVFNYNGSAIGSITQSGTTAVLYNTTSDQRLKENIQNADSASSLIDSLKVRQYDWKSDKSHQRYGFIAQELVTVAPEAVHQPVDPDDMMAVDYSKLVPMLVKEIQSLRKRLADAGIA